MHVTAREAVSFRQKALYKLIMENFLQKHVRHVLVGCGTQIVCIHTVLLWIDIKIIL